MFAHNIVHWPVRISARISSSERRVGRRHGGDEPEASDAAADNPLSAAAPDGATGRDAPAAGQRTDDVPAGAEGAGERGRRGRDDGRGRRRRLDEEQGERRPREATDERFHGVVARPTSQDGAGEPEDAQLGDQQAARRRVEAADGDGEAAVHRRGEATARHPHEGAPRLQVPAAAQDQDAAEEGQVRAAAGHGRAGWRAAADGGARHVRDEHERLHAERLPDDEPRAAHGLPAAGDVRPDVGGPDVRLRAAVFGGWGGRRRRRRRGRRADGRPDRLPAHRRVVHERRRAERLLVLDGAVPVGRPGAAGARSGADEDGGARRQPPAAGGRAREAERRRPARDDQHVPAGRRGPGALRGDARTVRGDGRRRTRHRRVGQHRPAVAPLISGHHRSADATGAAHRGRRSTQGPAQHTGAGAAHRGREETHGSGERRAGAGPETHRPGRSQWPSRSHGPAQRSIFCYTRTSTLSVLQ